MTDTDIAFTLAATFTIGCAAACGLWHRPEMAIRALSAITLGFGLFLGVALMSTAPGKAPRDGVAQMATRGPR